MLYNVIQNLGEWEIYWVYVQPRWLDKEKDNNNPERYMFVNNCFMFYGGNIKIIQEELKWFNVQP